MLAVQSRGDLNNFGKGNAQLAAVAPRTFKGPPAPSPRDPATDAMAELASAARMMAQAAQAMTPDTTTAALAELSTAAHQMALAAQAMTDAAQQVRPKQMEAIVQRDSAGRMEKVVINVV